MCINVGHDARGATSTATASATATLVMVILRGARCGATSIAPDVVAIPVCIIVRVRVSLRVGVGVIVVNAIEANDVGVSVSSSRNVWRGCIQQCW